MMKPSHRERLPVSKPAFEERSTKVRQRLPLPEPFRSSSAHEAESSDSSIRNNREREGSSQIGLPVPIASSNPQREPPDLASAPSELRLALPLATHRVSHAIEIDVQDEADRPFELGDLFTRQFVMSNSGFLISLAFHTLVLLLLSLVLIHGTGKALIMLSLISSPDVQAFDGVVAEFDVDINDLEQLMLAVDDDPFNSAFGNDDGDQNVVDQSAVTGAPGGGEESTNGKGDGKSAKFFGMRATGNKFVYVLDRSGSMAYESSDVTNYRVSRFDVARMELINSVESLLPHQEFYVVLFSSGMKQMFNKNALLPTPVKATPENKRLLKEWLWKDQAVGGTDPRESLKLAFKMNPDAIFMLSDGEFRDEKNDGKPQAIDIARKQVEENSPIRINSIALEDATSKANMEELSNVSGGQFKFVKVSDYVSKMASSPEQMFRLRIPDQPVSWMVKSWSDRLALAEKLIPLIESNQEVDRKDAEQRLHELSYGMFEFEIPSVAEASVSAETISRAFEDWSAVWATANDQTDLNAATSIGLFSILSIVGKKDFLESVERLDAKTMDPLQQIGVARAVLNFQDNTGQVTNRSRMALLDYLRELNQESTAKFNEENFLKGASQSTCERRLEIVLKNRRLRASRLLGKSKNKRLVENVRIEFARELIELYPETDIAREAAEKFNLPISLLDQSQ